MGVDGRGWRKWNWREESGGQGVERGSAGQEGSYTTRRRESA